VSFASHILHTQQGIHGLRHAKPPYRNGGSRLRRRIKLGTFAALDQRIALRCTMNGMEAAETKTYLPTTSNSPAAATRCSATTPQTSFTKSVAASRER